MLKSQLTHRESLCIGYEASGTRFNVWYLFYGGFEMSKIRIWSIAASQDSDELVQTATVHQVHLCPGTRSDSEEVHGLSSVDFQLHSSSGNLELEYITSHMQAS